MEHVYKEKIKQLMMSEDECNIIQAMVLLETMAESLEDILEVLEISELHPILNE